MGLEERWKAIVSGTEKGVFASLSRGLLATISRGYAAIMCKRNVRFDTDPTRVYHPPVPVVSIGNITVGGTGKTPMVAYVCEYYTKLGYHPVVLTRGYKARKRQGNHIVSDGKKLVLNAFESGDEANLLATSLVNVPVVIGSKRSDSAKLALEKMNPDVFVLDDAFQHRNMDRDVNMVLIDATNPFGYGHVLPRGLLREPLEGLKRATIFVITKVTQVEKNEVLAIERVLRNYNTSAPIVTASHAPQELVDLSGRTATIAKESPLFAITAIGNPTSFYHSLEEKGYVVGLQKNFLDHYVFTKKDLQHLFKEALENGYKTIIITEKDAVKWRPLVEGEVLPVKVLVLPVRMNIVEGREILEATLQKIVERK